MRGVFDEEELEPLREQRDTELTIGPMLLLGVFFALVLLCGLCFGVGYTLGHRSEPQPLTAGAQPVPAQAAPLMNASPPKPSASALNSSARAPQAAATPPESPVETTPAANSSAANSPASLGAAVVRPALPPQSAQSQPAQPASTSGPMVQIAAVSHQEDADVLVSALRKRGYAVSSSPSAADNRIHVRIGPFASRNEANNWRQKLLGDGYNAVVQP